MRTQFGFFSIASNSKLEKKNQVALSPDNKLWYGRITQYFPAGKNELQIYTGMCIYYRNNLERSKFQEGTYGTRPFL